MPESKKYFYLYQITNLINGKIYVGVHATRNLEDGYMGSGKRLHKAYTKYGKQNFRKEILKFCDSLDEVLEAERQIVTEEFCKQPNTYNIAVGGKCGGSLLAGKTPEEKAAWARHIQEVRKAQSQTPEWKAMRKQIRNSPEFQRKFKATRLATEQAMTDEQRQQRHVKLKIAHSRPEVKERHSMASMLKWAALTKEQLKQMQRVWYTDGTQNFLLRPDDPMVAKLTPGRSGMTPHPKYVYRIDGQEFYSEVAVHKYLGSSEPHSTWKKHNRAWLHGLRQEIKNDKQSSH